MKNLKKFLIALAIVAILVSSVAVIVSAVTDYSGSLADLNTLYEAYVEETGARKTTLAKQTTKLAKVYTYIADTPVDPDSEPAEGDLTYAEVMALADAATVSLGNKYIEAIDGAESGAVAVSNVTGLYNHISKCTPDEGTAGYAELLVEAENANVRAILYYAQSIETMTDGAKALESVVALDAHVKEYAPAPEATDAELVGAAFQKANAVAALNYVASTENMETGAAVLTAVNALYDHVAIYPLDESVEGVDGFPAAIEKANVKAVTLLHESAATAGTVAAMNTYLAIDEQLTVHPIVSTDNADYKAALAEISKGAAAVARARYEQIVEVPDDHVDSDADGKCDVSVCGADVTTPCYHSLARYNTIRVVQNFIKTVDVNSEQIPEGSTSIKQLVSSYVTLTAEEMEQRRTALDATANFDDYDLTSYHIVKNFNGLSDSDEDSLWTAYNVTAQCYPERLVDLNNNGYMNLTYGGTASHLYIEPNFGQNFVNGLVIEFDIMVDDTFTYQSFETREPSTGISKMYSVFYMQCSNRDGNITLSNNPQRSTQSGVKSTKVTGIIVPNVWTRMTVTYDNEARVGKLYVNYEYVMDLEYSEMFDFQGFRMGTSRTDQNVGYDNFEIYQGASYRDFDKFEVMTDRQKFEYYVDFMLDSTNNNLSRNSAYQKAKALSEKYEADDPYVIKFVNCDYDNDIKKPAMAENISILTEMVSELSKMPINSKEVGTVNAAINEIDTFIKVNSELINKGDTSVGGYQDQMALINEVKADLLLAENIVAFTNAVAKFKRATSYTAMAKHAATAKGIFDLAGYADEENVKFVSEDPAVVEFESEFNGITKPADDADPEDEAVKAAIEAWNKRTTLFQYYSEFTAIMAAQLDYENSKRIINCVDLITSLDGYEDTKEFWSANEEYISNYANIVRTILNEGNYKAEVEGLDEAIARYDVINVYFYELLQKQHIAAITEQLAKYAATDSYIIKVGVVNYVTQYIAENDLAVYVDADGNTVYKTDLDPELAEAIADEVEELASVMVTYEVYLGELDIQNEDYLAVLEENTTYFINTIAHMDTVITYAELKPLFDTATTYYHSMDVESEAASVAVDKYNDYRIMLASYEENGAIFVGYAAMIAEADELEGVEKQDAIFAALVNCMTYVSLTDMGVEGVAEAYEAYEAALEAYNAEAQSVASDVSESAKVTCAVRSECIASTILAIIGKIFGI